MVQRAIAKGYQWLDLSLTGEDNPDTWDIAHRMGARDLQALPFLREGRAGMNVEGATLAVRHHAWVGRCAARAGMIEAT